MASLRISQLPSLSAITGTDIIPIVSTSIVSSGDTYKITYNTLSNGDYQLFRNKTINQSGFTFTFAGNLNSKVVISQKFEQGLGNLAFGIYSHAQGQNTNAYGDYSHAEGYGTKSTGVYSHAQGYNTETRGNYSFAAGIGTNTWAQGQSALGKYNTTGNTSSLFVIGNGTSVFSRSDLALFNTTGLTINGNLIVTGTTNIKPYNVYIGLLSQTGSSAPTDVVLENTLGFTPVWSYISAGTYSISQLDGFPIEKVYVNTPLIVNNNINDYYAIDNTYFPNTLIVKTLSGLDDSLDYSPIEIRVYN
jgi:hypothetical protein